MAAMCARARGVAQGGAAARGRRANGSAPPRAAPRCAASRHGSRAAAAASAVVFDVQGQHLEVTPAIEAHVEEKVGAAVAAFADTLDVQTVQVRLSSRGGAAHKTKGDTLQKVELTTRTKRGVVRAERSSDNLYASVDAAADVLHRKLRKLKDKVKAKHSRSPADRSLADLEDMDGGFEDEAAEAIARATAAATEVTLPSEPARVKHFELEPMSVEQAMEAMRLSDHDFFLFRDGDTHDIRLVYARKSGGYGVIVPKPWIDWDDARK